MNESLFAYWQGFTPSGPAPDNAPALRDTPEFVDVLATAFSVVGEDSSILTGFLTKGNTKATILADTEFLRGRGQKVITSLNGNADVPWSTLKPTLFAKSVKALAAEWQLDGIDLDYETAGTVPGTAFADVIKALRDTMGEDFIISYPAYLPFRDQFLSQVVDEVSWVMTMAYWNDYEWAVGLYKEYAEIVGDEKVMIGIKPGRGGHDQSTPITAVPKLAAYEPQGSSKAGVMIYSLSIDYEQYTDKPRFAWADLVHTNMP